MNLVIWHRQNSCFLHHPEHHICQFRHLTWSLVRLMEHSLGPSLTQELFTDNSLCLCFKYYPRWLRTPSQTNINQVLYYKNFCISLKLIYKSCYTSSFFSGFTFKLILFKTLIYITKPIVSIFGFVKWFAHATKLICVQVFYSRGFILFFFFPKIKLKKLLYQFVFCRYHFKMI